LGFFGVYLAAGRRRGLIGHQQLGQHLDAGADALAGGGGLHLEALRHGQVAMRGQAEAADSTVQTRQTATGLMCSRWHRIRDRVGLAGLLTEGQRGVVDGGCRSRPFSSPGGSIGQLLGWDCYFLAVDAEPDRLLRYRS